MKLAVTKTAFKQLLRIPYKIRFRIEKKIEQLTDNPFPVKAKKLSGRPGYCLRIGDYRVLYFVNKNRKEIIVLRVQHRKGAYREA